MGAHDFGDHTRFTKGDAEGGFTYLRKMIDKSKTLMDAGKSNAEIAEIMGISEKYVQGLVFSREGSEFEKRLEIESELHRKIFEVLDAHPHVMEQDRLRDYMDFFFNPGEVIYQETVILPDEKDAEEGWEGTGKAVLCAVDKPEVVMEENGFLMHAHTKVPNERDETGGMWVEVHSVDGSGPIMDKHDKFKRMLGRPIRVTVEILDKPS